MPQINGQYVDFDPEHLADAVAAGHEVRPDRYDFETEDQYQRRQQGEYEQISGILKRKNPKAWRKWHGLPEPGEPDAAYPWNEWDKLPTQRNIGTLARTGPPQNQNALNISRPAPEVRAPEKMAFTPVENNFVKVPYKDPFKRG